MAEKECSSKELRVPLCVKERRDGRFVNVWEEQKAAKENAKLSVAALVNKIEMERTRRVEEEMKRDAELREYARREEKRREKELPELMRRARQMREKVMRDVELRRCWY